MGKVVNLEEYKLEKRIREANANRTIPAPTMSGVGKSGTLMAMMAMLGISTGKISIMTDEDPTGIKSLFNSAIEEVGRNDK